MSIYVQFDRDPFDADGATPNMSAVVIAYASAPQPAETWPFQGAIETSDARWAVYYAAAPAFLKAYLPQPTAV